MNANNPLSIVPAFFLIEAASEEADEKASQHVIDFNNHQRIVNQSSTRLRLCEASPTTEWTEGEAPTTLEGLTIDSGSDRSAAGLITNIAKACDECPLPEASAAIATISHVHQLADGWLRQRMALHPMARPIEPAKAVEEQDAASLLLHAYARGEAKGGSIDWSDLNEAYERARAEYPGRYEEILGLYLEQEGTANLAEGDETEDVAAVGQS